MDNRRAPQPQGLNARKHMRSSKSRSRSKSNRQRTTLGNITNRVFDSSGPEGKVRGTPQQIIDRINTEVDSIIRMSSVAQRLVSLGADPAGGSPTAFKSFIHEDIRNWDAIAKLANVSSNLK